MRYASGLQLTGAGFADVAAFRWGFGGIGWVETVFLDLPIITVLRQQIGEDGCNADVR